MSSPGGTSKPASESEVMLARQMEVTDANIGGNVHGGTIMKMVDTAGGLAAAKHCGSLAVTAAMDEMSFLEPVYVGDVVTVKAMVNQAFGTSMEVGVRVEAESVRTGRRVHTSSAYLVFVAVDDHGRPRKVPPLLAETDEQRQRQEEAGLRRQARLARKRAIEDARAAGADA
ncbi:MAG TPA: acyl-CoA thioesterase [Actinomycetota bacterium]|jgi:acyl-CoA hydrolase|nr:acyl-CoA thioesterase [Actinomycetota bacterium]